MKNKEISYFGEILKTKNYGIFKGIKCNRILRAKNYAKLLRSMKEEQLIIPICVNEKYEIIDGQHRLKVCEELGLPIYFYVLEGYSTAQMKRANLVSSTWTKDDFLHAYAEEGVRSYEEFSDMKKRYGLTTNNLITIISKVQETSIAKIGLDFEEGNLKTTSKDKIEIINFLVSLEDFSFFKDYRSRAFVSAFIDIYFCGFYEHEKMKKKLKTKSQEIKKLPVKDDYIELLIYKIYTFNDTKNRLNYNRSKKEFYIS